MGAVTRCYYRDCYYNHNIKHQCLLPKITLDFTGTCERIMHCDEYECDTCERFVICSKEKKKAFGAGQTEPKKVLLRYAGSIPIGYCDNDHCIYSQKSKCQFSGGITLDSNATCQMAEYPGEDGDLRSEEPPDDDISGFSIDRL